ncbi:MAG: D-lyxose/D-mannose family sugar isomerase [Chloroflexi bacterium]|nr:D-lyxose/D-mannose family sugar isomerase [Chloroflexota bacterium]
MITQIDFQIAQKRALEYLQRAGIAITPGDAENIEVADYGLGELWQTGLELLTYLHSDRVCARELVLLPWQTCPEHLHPTMDGQAGKEETIRCRWGTVYLYTPGRPAPSPRARPPENRTRYYSVWHETVLRPGDQVTLSPDTKHWFQSGAAGAVISEFSNACGEEYDLFTDPGIQRVTLVNGD